MKIPVEAVIAPEKLTRYLLIFREEDDKSKFLSMAGFTLDNPDELEAALRTHIQESEAFEQKANLYGVFYEVPGQMNGVNGRILEITSIWLYESATDEFRFITLKGRKSET